jgi:16S rRNA (adenine1518-N6/adenine1519-N6)-dimethyltransferase
MRRASQRSRTRKRFGQHFLEPAWVTKVIAAIHPRPDDVFIEIGPGRGALTRPLAATVRGVVAFEIDRDLAAMLGSQGIPGVRLVEKDFLHVTADDVQQAMAAAGLSHASDVRVAGNLPYNVASPIIFRLLELRKGGVPLTDATLMLQREVADRVLAAPGSRDYGVLSILVQHCAEGTRLINLPPGAFRPPPEVRSALVGLRFRAPDPPVVRPDVFTAITRAIFTRRRKTIVNALRAYGSASLAPAKALAEAGIAPVRRPETLTIKEVARLADVYARAGL